MIYSTQPVILCGGSGSRLWPLSRTGFPKQFLCLAGESSLFQQAVQRTKFEGLDLNVKPSIIVAGEEHRFLVLEQLREIGHQRNFTILEPAAKNTAAALTLAALAAIDDGDDSILVVTPADQVIDDLSKFEVAIKSAIKVAAEDKIVIFGIKPTLPNTGYGYIQVDVNLDRSEIFDVLNFFEKPKLLEAEKFIEEGNCYWNAGIFVLKASIWLKALKQFRSDIFNAATTSWEGKSIDNSFIRPVATNFLEIPSESIDYAVIEKCSGSNFEVKMISLDAGWNDLGSWDSVWTSLPKDSYGNARVGDVLATNCKNTFAYASHRLISLVGVNDLIVVETADAVLVVKKHESQNVKDIVNIIEANKRKEHINHRKTHRPWGWYDSIDEGERFKVKRIQVKPKASLSLQKHQHRAEHWVVVRGTAQITNGEKVITLVENQSTFIPRGVVHRLFNPGNDPLEIIEVQSGSYLAEDDIVRLEDNYGR